MRVPSCHVTVVRRASLVGLASITSVGACAGTSAEPRAAKESEPPIASSSLVAESAMPESRRGKLASAPARLTLGQFWPTKICTRGAGMIVVANSCVCDSKMTCAITRRGNVLDLHVGMSQELCKDCGTFLAVCATPPDALPPRGRTRTFKIAIDGKPVLEALEIPRTDAPATEHCYE